MRADEPVVEMRADRVTIYPGRMDLTGEETVIDVLQMYPDLLVNGFENWLEGYSIRIDNGPYGGDMRQILTKMRAADVWMIQISDNPGVAKGTTGMNGVVDLFMKPSKEASGEVAGQGEPNSSPVSTRGIVAAEISTNLTVTPFVEFMMGSKSTDILANASYNYRHDVAHPTHQQFGNFHMTNRLSDRDQLVTYFTQSYEQMRNKLDTTRLDNRNFNSQLRHYHDFPHGTNLMTAVIYQHTFAPLVRFSLNDGHTVSFMSSDWQGTLAAAQELNRSFAFSDTYLNQLNLMVGWEVDYGMGVQREEDEESQIAQRTLNYRVMNADAYFELDYRIQKWRFTFGDRVMFYRYRVDVPVGDRTHNDWRNMAHMSVVFSPNHEHNVQLGYYRKFYNPSYMGLFREAKGMTDEEWLLAEKNITETQMNEVKLGYTFARKWLTTSMNMYYYNVAHVYDFFRVDVSAFYRHEFLTVSGGINYYHSADLNYASFRLAPVFKIPYGMQVRTQTIVYTPGSPARKYNYDKPVYASLLFNKLFTFADNMPTLDVYVMWHDIFNGQYGTGLLGVQLNW